MVLYKRKPVQLLAPPKNIPDQAEIFVVKGTNEIFTDYEKYLQRYDFLSQKKFVDAVNGKSGLTYFAALASEAMSSNAIESVFPEVLRDPILRKVQFSTTSRMDDLVDEVFAEFRHDFFPGEDVICMLDDNERITGVVREKAKFPMIRGPSGDIQREAFSRYFVRLNTGRDEEGLLDDKHLRRDRKVFTKLNLRAFLKHSLQRESWNGAPWLVKEALAIQYRLPMEIPAHLLQEAKLLAHKQQMLQSHQIPRRRPKNMAPEEFRRMRQDEMARIQQLPPQANGPAHRQNNTTNPQQTVAAPRAADAKPLPPPVIKYPIEDLDLPMKRNGVKRPKLKFLSSDEGFDEVAEDSSTTGMLLEVWNTLNVQCEVYCLDSFTFDDFVDAMNYKSTGTPCELLEEIHCAVLKLLVDENGHNLLTKGALPDMADEEDSESDGQDESELSTPLADAPARSTRSRLSHISIVSSAAPEKVHCAQDMLGQTDWMSRLAKRDFEHGGWQVILVGVLHNMSLLPYLKPRCDRVLAILAPTDGDPTRETARQQYYSMDINARISALQLITMLSVSTQGIRDFLEACSDDMTDVRKKKIEHQRLKKQLLEELAVKDRERKILLPTNLPPETEKRESVEAGSPDVESIESSIDASNVMSSDAEDEPPTNGRSLRRGQDRKRKREEEAARRAEERARKAEAAKPENKQSREFKKLLTEIEEIKKQIIETESKVAECDNDLREANVQRTKVLGKDRFCNRYYWYERNGQPYGGLPRSSTAGYGYANGRIWVQGPDTMELEGFVGDTKELQNEYQKRMGASVVERRKLEEGDTILHSAHEWGYYDDPQVLDNLIQWLDERGERERSLRKELIAWRDTIVQYMDARKKFFADEAARRAEAADEGAAAATSIATRISTRRQERGDHLAIPRHRCLKWTNTMAIEENGHLHSQTTHAKPKGRHKANSSAASAAAQSRQMKGIALPVNRYGKPLTRQGGRLPLK